MEFREAMREHSGDVGLRQDMCKESDREAICCEGGGPRRQRGWGSQSKLDWM